MSSLHNQPDVEDIVSAFESTQNQSWSEFSDKLGGNPIKDCKKKDIFKSENPIELSDEDIPVFGVIPRLEKLLLVSCKKCSMIVKNDCIHYHYQNRHNDPENDLFSVAQFIAPNVKTNKHKRPKLSIRKLPEKKIIDGVNIDPIVQEIKTEFDQVEFERISELNRVIKQQGNINQYDNVSTPVNLAIHCTPGTSYFNELSTQSLVQYPDQNEEIDQMTDYEEDITKSVDLLKESQNNKCVEDIGDSINDDKCITKVEFNENGKRKIDHEDSVNNEREFYETNHPKKKYHHLSLYTLGHSSFKTSSSCSDVLRNQNSDYVFTCCDQEVKGEITENDINFHKCISDGKELQTIDNADTFINSKSVNFASKNIDCKSFGESFNNIKTNFEQLKDSSSKPNLSNDMTLSKHAILVAMKNQSSDNFVENHDRLLDIKIADCDKLLDDEIEQKSINIGLNNIAHQNVNNVETERNGENLQNNVCVNNNKNEKVVNYFTISNDPLCKLSLNLIKKREQRKKSKDFMDNNKYHYVPFESSSLSSTIEDGEDEYIADKTNDLSEDVLFPVSHESNHDKRLKVFTPISQVIKDLNNQCSSNPVPINDKSSTIEPKNEQIDEFNSISNNINLSLPPMSSLSLDNEKLNESLKVTDDQCSNKYVLDFHKPSPLELMELVDKMNNIMVKYKTKLIPIPSRSFEDEKLKHSIPVNKFIKSMDVQCFNDSNPSIHKPTTDDHDEFEDKINQNEVHSNIVCSSLPSKLNNGDNLRTHASINKVINTMDNLSFSNSNLNFHKSSFTKNDNLTIEHQKCIDPITDNHNISNVHRDKTEDEMAPTNEDFNIIYLQLPPKSLNDIKPKKFMSFNKFEKEDEHQQSNDSITDDHNVSNDEHDEFEDEMDSTDEDSHTIILPLPPKSYFDSIRKKYSPDNKFDKVTQNLQCNSSVTDFYKHSYNQHNENENKIGTAKNDIKISLENKPKQYVHINEFKKVMGDQYSNNSVSNFIPSENVEEDIKISTSYKRPSNSSDSDENIKSKMKMYQSPSMNSNSKVKCLPSFDNSKVLNNKESDKVVFDNNHSIILPYNTEEETKFAQNNHSVIKNSENPDDVNSMYNNSLTASSQLKRKSKLSPPNDLVVKKEYFNNDYYDTHYQRTNYYTVSQELKPLPSGSKHLDLDQSTSNGEEFCGKNHEILKSNSCLLSSGFSNNENVSSLKSTNAYSGIMNNKNCNDTFNSCNQVSAFPQVDKESKPLPLIKNSIVTIGNNSNNYYEPSSQLLDNQEKVKWTSIKYSDILSHESSDSSTSSYDQSVLLIDHEEKTKLSFSDIFSDTQSDENSNDSTKLEDDEINSIKYIQTDGSYKHVNHQTFLDSTIRIDKSIIELHDTSDDNTKYCQTDLSFDCVGNIITSEDFINNYAPVNSNDGVVKSLITSCSSGIFNSSIAEFANTNSVTSICSRAKNINNTIAPSSTDGFEVKDNNDVDHNTLNSTHYLPHFQRTLWSSDSHNDHFSKCATHQSVSDSIQTFESNDNTCGSYVDQVSDRAEINEFDLNHNTDDELTSLVDKYFRKYKEHLKKTMDEKLANGMNQTITSRDNFESKMRKNSKKRLEAKVVDKENYDVWNSYGIPKYDRILNFVQRPALYRHHYYDKTDEIEQ